MAKSGAAFRDSQVGYLPAVELSDVRLNFRLHPEEFRQVDLLLGRLSQASPQDLGTLAKLWGQCPTVWGWLIASHPTLKHEPITDWLAKSPKSLADAISRSIDSSEVAPRWLTVLPGPPLAACRHPQFLPTALIWLWDQAEASSMDRAAASAILLLSETRVPWVTSTQAGQRSFPPNWHGRPACQWVRDFRQQNPTSPQVELALKAQEASSKMAVGETGSVGSEETTNALSRLFVEHLQQKARLEQEKLASLKQLAYGASHEVNNPLANISTRAQTLLQDESNPERRQKLAAIVAQAFRAHDMISNMMLFAHPPAIQRQRFELRPWLETQLSELQFLTAEQGTTLEVISKPTIASDQMVEGDPHQLGILLQSLVRNACEALGTGGAVQVSASISVQDSTNLMWVLEVSDDGPGMTEENRRHCFDPFYSGREAGRGLGLGLSKAWAITQLHGGSIEIFENEPQGLAFQVTLPNGMIEAQEVDFSSEEVPCKTTPTAG